VKATRRSDKKTFATAALYVLAFILCILLVREAAVLSLSLPGPSLTRLLVFLPIAIALVAGLSWTAATRSLLWQVPLQSAAVGLLLAALPVLVGGLFGNWSVYSTTLGLKAAGIALLGFLAAWLLRYLQRRVVPGQDA